MSKLNKWDMRAWFKREISDTYLLLYLIRKGREREYEKSREKMVKK